MKSPKIKTIGYNNNPRVRNISAILAIILAATTLLQASTLKSNTIEREVSMLEAELIAEIDQFYAEDEMAIEEAIYIEMEEEAEAEVSVFDSNDELVASGNPSDNDELRKLVNQADYLSEFGNTKYYRIAK